MRKDKDSSDVPDQTSDGPANGPADPTEGMKPETDPKNQPGDIPVDDPPDVTKAESASHAREVQHRLMRQKLWKGQADATRDELYVAGRKLKRSHGWTREQVQWWVWSQLDEMYPDPVQPDAITESAQPDRPQDQSAGIVGLTDLPDSWGQLPDTAQQAAEFGWVQANRLLIVRTQGSRSVIDYGQARGPAPSMASISWLEYSILNPAGWSTMAAKGMQAEEDESEFVRQERMAIKDIESILAEHHDDRRDRAVP